MEQNSNTQPKSNHNLPIYFIYTCTLIAFFVASFFPENRIWGFNNYAYLPDLWKYSLFLFFLIVPVLITFFLNRGLSTELKKELSDRYFYIISGLITAVFGILFYFFRATTHFLGDGYTVLSNLSSENPILKFREIGESLTHLWVKDIIGTGEIAALLSFQIISIIAGILFILSTIYFSHTYFNNSIKRLLFSVGILSCGYMLLFFGYVEYYSLFVVSVLLYTYTGLLITSNKFNKYLIIPVLFISIFFHVIGTTLIPSAIYLLLRNTKFEYKIKHLSVRLKIILSSLILFFLIVLYNYVGYKYLFFRFATLQLFADNFTVEGYTLFSTNHIMDFINIFFFLIPALPLMIFLLFKKISIRSFKKNEYRFLLLLSVSTILAVFIFDPKLGMPRDWDLFSFSGVPFMIIFLVLYLQELRPSLSRTIIILSISLNLFLFIPKVYCQRNSSAAIEQIEIFFSLDKTKSRPGYNILTNYYNDQNNFKKAQETQKKLENKYPEVQMNYNATIFFDENKYNKAISIYENIISINPMYADAYNNLGDCFLSLNKFDTAIALFNISLGLNPHREIFYYNLGYAYYFKNDFINAENAWLKSIYYDKTQFEPVVNIAQLYKKMGDNIKYLEYLKKAAEFEQAPHNVLVELGNLYLKKGDLQNACLYYKKAIERGWDSKQINPLIEQYPNLKSYFFN